MEQSQIITYGGKKEHIDWALKGTPELTELVIIESEVPPVADFYDPIKPKLQETIEIYKMFKKLKLRLIAISEGETFASMIRTFRQIIW